MTSGEAVSKGYDHLKYELKILPSKVEATTGIHVMAKSLLVFLESEFSCTEDKLRC